jgi:hypothetical protein
VYAREDGFETTIAGSYVGAECVPYQRFDAVMTRQLEIVFETSYKRVEQLHGQTDRD